MKLRDHACPYCPSVAYQTKQHLTRHIDTVHLKLRNHACPYCPGVAYQTKSHLTRHIHRCTLKSHTSHACRKELNSMHAS